MEFRLKMAKKLGFKIEVLEDRCKSCDLCVDSCPKDLMYISEKRNVMGLKVAEQRNPEECPPCPNCYLICPDGAIKMGGYL